MLSRGSGGEATRDRSSPGADVQHELAGKLRRTRQQGSGHRPVDKLRAIGPRGSGTLVATPSEGQVVGRSHGRNTCASATLADHHDSSSASPSAFSQAKVAIIAMTDNPSWRSNQPPVSIPATSSAAR